MEEEYLEEFEQLFLKSLEKVKTIFTDVPIEIQEKLIKKIQYEWLPSYLEEIKQGQMYCYHCKRYFEDRKEIKVTAKIRKSIVSCYGDDDRYEEVEELVYYKTCPYCKGEVEYKF